MSRLFTIIDAEQRSREWFTARLGRLTGSCAAHILSKGRGKDVESVGRRDLRLRLALERITGLLQEDDDWKSKEMQRGIEMEAPAFAAYEAATGQLVERTGFLSHTKLLAGCSLDGHVDDFAGILEVKCPKSATHYRYLTARTLPPEYVPQVSHNMWITGAEWCDFISFDDRFPPALQLFRIRVLRTDLDIPAYELAASLFLSEVEKEVEGVIKLAGGLVAA